jgi:riboflavin kinase/FMN adenylyltransferase
VTDADVRLSGVVVGGDRRGRELGFPTANVRICNRAGSLDFGVYAGLVDGLPAAISIGVRPTFGEGREPLLEAYILDFDGDLYGRTVDVELLQWIRGERNFSDVTELVDEMHRDVDRVRELLADHARHPAH